MFHLSIPLFATSDLSEYSNRISQQFTSYYKFHFPIIDSGKEIFRLCYQNYGKCSIWFLIPCLRQSFPMKW